ncbi:hypothetical protein A0H81_13575 [Grifola frondosa]|uniref:Uncharacterized protein n=1 Tax=Grifola frondosa TaxID=5627 RepID=A0A1C7LR14_GRIFR|nr:hypothetical protein A0H81_13575 [Grifola frondosa]
MKQQTLQNCLLLERPELALKVSFSPCTEYNPRSAGLLFAPRGVAQNLYSLPKSLVGEDIVRGSAPCAVWRTTFQHKFGPLQVQGLEDPLHQDLHYATV